MGGKSVKKCTKKYLKSVKITINGIKCTNMNIIFKARHLLHNVKIPDLFRVFCFLGGKWVEKWV